MYKYFLLVITFGFLATPYSALSAVTPNWETTFQCDYWDATYGDDTKCDGMTRYGAWTGTNGEPQAIIPAANNPNGRGGSGLRTWICNGTNSGSGSVRIKFTTSQSNIWLRWYQRWESGFSSKWNTFKNIWFEPQIAGRIVYHTEGNGSSDLTIVTSTAAIYDDPNLGYGVNYYSTGTSDGTWQLHEVNIDIPNRTYTSWLNGTLIKKHTGVNYPAGDKIAYIDMSVNIKDLVNSKACMYLDFDDIAISNTGYIGPIDSKNISLPVPPPPVTLNEPQDFTVH